MGKAKKKRFSNCSGSESKSKAKHMGKVKKKTTKNKDCQITLAQGAHGQTSLKIVVSVFRFFVFRF